MFDRPLFILGAPRSGTTMVFDALIRSPDAVSLRNESHGVIEALPGLTPAAHGWESNRLDERDATREHVAALTAGFRAAVVDAAGRRPADDATALRLVEKTPKNTLRVPFLAAAFPTARFLHVHREPHETLASLMESWAADGFVTYPDLPGWTGLPWSHLLIPGWRDLVGRPLPEIVAAQWRAAVEHLLDALDTLEPDRVLSLTYDMFLDDPAAACARAWEFAELTPGPVPARLPVSGVAVSPPAGGKWRRHADALAPHLDVLAPLAERARARALDPS